METMTVLACAAAGISVYFGYFGVLYGLALLVMVALSCFTGIVGVCLYHGKKRSDETYGQAHPPLEPLPLGIPSICKMMDEPKPSDRLDKRLTGASNIDDQLNQLLDLLFRYYVHSWYSRISDDTAFETELRRIFMVAISSLASRAKEVEWTPFFTQVLVDELASHVKLYRRAEMKAKTTKGLSNERDEIEERFFEFEFEMEGKKSRRAVCSDPELEKAYLKEVTEALLYFLVPEDCFENQILRGLIREVLVNSVLTPTINQACSPDYVNQNVIWMCDESSFTSKSLITALMLSQSVGEIQAINVKVAEEIARTRAKDSGGADDSAVKQTLSSLAYLQKVCELQTKRLSQTDVTDSPFSLDPAELKKKVSRYSHLTWRDVIKNEYFTEYVEITDREAYLNLMLDILEINSLGSLALSRETPEYHNAALEILTEFYEKHFNLDGPGLTSIVELTPSENQKTVQPLRVAIEKKHVEATTLHPLTALVSEKLATIFDQFRQHTLYLKLIDEVEINKISDSYSLNSFSDETGEDDVISVSSLESAMSPVKNHIVSAAICKTGIVKEPVDNKTYAVYSILAVATTASVDCEKVKEWTTTRRYTDFYTLNAYINEQWNELSELPFPAKKTFKNMSKDFIEHRAASLNKYLQSLLDHRLNDEVLQKVLYDFLQAGPWTQPKLQPALMGALMNPFKQGVRQMSNKVKQVPDVLFGDVIDGFGKVFKQMSFSPSLSKNQLESYRVGKALDVEDEDNIPMRIMLLLMDEVFDLRKKNQWLRRRIVAILRQIVKATYGDKINKKIIDHVDSMTSAEAVADYVKQFRERFWPMNIPAEPSPMRDQETRLRTQIVCQAKLIGSLPDELRHVIGTDTTRAGVLRVYRMFQHERLNKRLIYAIMESFIQTLYPANSFEKVFHCIHTKSSRGRADSSLSNS